MLPKISHFNGSTTFQRRIGCVFHSVTLIFWIRQTLQNTKLNTPTSNAMQQQSDTIPKCQAIINAGYLQYWGLEIKC